MNEGYELRLKLLSLLLHGENISPVLTEIAERDGNFMAVIDTSGKILAHSEPNKETDPIWRQSVRDGFCPPELIEHMQGIRRRQAVGPGERAFVRYCESFEVYYLCSRIIVSGRLFGNVFMIQKERDFPAEDRELLAFIAESLETGYERQKDRMAVREQARGSLLADILAGAPEEQIDARIQSSGFHFPEKMRAIVVRPQYYLPESELAEQVAAEAAVFPEVRSLTFHQSLVLVVGCSRIENDEIREKLTPVCRKWHLTAAISDSFTRIHELKVHFENADRCIALAKKLGADGSVQEYAHFRVADLLDQIPVDKDLKRFAHPALGILRRYDERKKTNFYETLMTYTLSGFNQNQTAESLYLHRNTLNYRRRKIEELTGLDLEDPEERFQLRLSFEMERLMSFRRP